MKKIALISIILFLNFISNGQIPPQAVNYQGVARDGSGNAIVNQTISLEISIVSNTGLGQIEYQETHLPTTNQFGSFSVAIGRGDPTIGSFNSVAWSDSKKFMRIRIDISGGTNFVTVGNSEILSVPYAIYAGNGDKVITLTGSGSTTITGTYPNLGINTPKMVAGEGISILGNNLIINTAIDKTITIIGIGNISITGAYPNFSISSISSLNELPDLTQPVPIRHRGKILYVHPTDNGFAPWSPAKDYLGLLETSGLDGMKNTMTIVGFYGSGNYAAKVCYDLVAFGKDDWFLPSDEELLNIFQHGLLFENLMAKNNTEYREYISSSENDIDNYYSIVNTFRDVLSGPSTRDKLATYSSLTIRCVRKD